jgi:hypothetical protein
MKHFVQAFLRTLDSTCQHEASPASELDDRCSLETRKKLMNNPLTLTIDAVIGAAPDDAVGALLGFGFIDDRRFGVSTIRLDGLATVSTLSQGDSEA